ncbi:MAG: NYN domain-containing protein [Phycisphaerae bacterium]|nr:NYN domain-containing protein [Phycisphaerae bacterium]
MPTLIDGNNLLHAVRAIEDPERLFGRLMLGHRLAEWASRAGEHIRVVYDGIAPPTEVAQQYEHANVAVTFSGAGVTADAVIIQILEADSAARRLLVVSSDREVARAAKRRRSMTISSSDFWAVLKRDLARRPRPNLEPEEKRRGLDREATDEWLREFGLDEGTAEW